jgi:O-antigen ligase/tetratricopeptide (TPR) repeat protein
VVCMKRILEAAVFTGIFTVPFLVLLVTESLFFPYITGKNFAFRIIVEIVFAAWILLALYDKAYRPRFSWILGLFAAFISVMFFANLFGEYPFKSFWSNFERMEGYISLAHVFLYFIVLGSAMGVKTERWVGTFVASIAAFLGVLFMGALFANFPGGALWSYPTGFVTISAFVFFGILIWQSYSSVHNWNRFFNVTLAVLVLSLWYAFAQAFGTIAITQGAMWRPDGTLGNSTYMAVYMLFHIFIAAMLFTQSTSRFQKIVYGVLMLSSVFILLQTGTRGAALGLVGGAFIALAYTALFAKGHKTLRTVALTSCVIIVLLGALFVVFRDSSFVQNDKRLSRIADTTLEEGKARFTIWGVAFAGVKERPILGWGQESFDSVFNKYYTPLLYGQEVWFDRVHNIVLDWLIAGGILGALCYFGIIAAALFYLVILPVKTKASQFTVVERGLLLGLFAAYVFHNLFVFDNIVSYVFLAVILAHIHARVAVPIAQIEKVKLAPYQVSNIAAPIAGVLLVSAVYALNIPGIQAAGDIIDAYRTQTPEAKLIVFEKALSRGSFANQEIREQMMQQALMIFAAPNIPLGVKQQWFTSTEGALKAQIEEEGGDTRSRFLFGVFYKATNNLALAREQLAEARATSPLKLQIIWEQGIVELQDSRVDDALSFFKEAYDLAPDVPQGRIYYAIGALYAGNDELFATLIHTDELKAAFAKDNLAVNAVFGMRRFGLLKELLRTLIESEPQYSAARVQLAAVYAEEGNTAEAISTLESAVAEIPAFKAEGEMLITQLRNGTSAAPGAEPSP